MKKTKMPKFGPKIALFGYFWDKIIKSYCHIWNQHPQICQNLSFSICNFQSMKRPAELNSFFLKFFCYITWFDETRDCRACKRGLYAEFYCFFETIGYWLEKLQHALTHTLNFGIGSVFFKGSGSISSQGPDPGPGPLFNVYLLKGRQLYLHKYVKFCVLVHIIS